MSDHPKPYSQLAINAWTILSLLIAATIFIFFCFGQQFLAVGHWIWDLIRYLCLPII